MTAIQMINLAIESCRQQQRENCDGATAREFALSITHLEDASMRFNRGMAMKVGSYTQADIEARTKLEEEEILAAAAQLEDSTTLDDPDELPQAA